MENQDIMWLLFQEKGRDKILCSFPENKQHISAGLAGINIGWYVANAACVDQFYSRLYLQKIL